MKIPLIMEIPKKSVHILKVTFSLFTPLYNAYKEFFRAERDILQKLEMSQAPLTARGSVSGMVSVQA